MTIAEITVARLLEKGPLSLRQMSDRLSADEREVRDVLRSLEEGGWAAPSDPERWVLRRPVYHSPHVAGVAQDATPSNPMPYTGMPYTGMPYTGWLHA